MEWLMVFWVPQTQRLVTMELVHVRRRDSNPRVKGHKVNGENTLELQHPAAGVFGERAVVTIEQQGTESDQSLTTDLQYVLEVWPKLPQHIRAAIHTLIAACQVSG